MAFPGSVILNFVAKTTDAIKDVDKLAGHVKDLGDDSKKTDKRMGGLSGTLKKGLAVGAAVAGAGIIALGDFMIEAGKAALEDKQSADLLANSLESIPGVTQKAIDANEDWILSMTIATSVADTDLREAVGKLALATGDLTEAQKLTALAADVAAGSGKSLTTITDLLVKAVSGNTTALKKQFPWLDKNKDGVIDLDEAIDGLGDAYGGAAEAAADTDPWTRIQTIWGELKESLGNWLLPLVNKFSEWFKDPKNQKAIQNFIDKAGEMAELLGEDLVDAIKKVVEWLKDPKNQKALKDWADNMWKIAKAVQNVIEKLITLKSWVDKLPSNWILKKLGMIPDFNAQSTPPPGSAGSWSIPAANPGMAPVMVTEEQVYRAVSRLIMRGEVRNGRRVMT